MYLAYMLWPEYEIALFIVQVYSFGNGSGVGKGTTEPRQYSPWLIEPLEGEMVIDISTGDGHCLALTQSRFMCGQGMCINASNVLLLSHFRR